MATVHRVIEVTVQCGVPENNELVYNIHVSNTGTGFVWDVSYRFSQLGTLDHDIATGCEKMKDIKFPQIDDTLMQLLTGKKSYPNRLSNLNKYRALIEEWIHQLITRSHMMPHILTELVEDWFCLPDGPHDNWQPGRALSAAEQNALHEQRQMEKLAASRPPEPPGKLQGNHKTHSVLNYFSGSKQNKDREAENDKKFNNSLTKNENPLLKVRVQRGQVGRNGKVEYDVSIFVILYNN